MGKKMRNRKSRVRGGVKGEERKRRGREREERKGWER